MDGDRMMARDGSIAAICTHPSRVPCEAGQETLQNETGTFRACDGGVFYRLTCEPLSMTDGPELFSYVLTTKC